MYLHLVAKNTCFMLTVTRHEIHHAHKYPNCCVVMQISMIIQIWVLVSMMDFMPGKGEHETCFFCHFYGKSRATSWRYVHVNVMSHININKFKMVEQRLCS